MRRLSNATAHELLDYARTQAGAATCAQQADGVEVLPADSFRGYKTVRRIKQGGQGVVYAGVEETTGKRVAIKVLRSGPFRGRTERRRFEREIQILARLEHPHIVTIHSSGTVAGHPYYVMDYVAGRALDEFIEDEDPPIDALLAMFLKICDAVHAAHLHGIVHRDLKPSNIRIDEHGEPRVLDFGLAKPLADEAGDGRHDPDMTTTGQFVGSLPWAAPEQLASESEPIDLRTDVYGLGLLLYTMLAKTPPFERSSNPHDMMDDILKRDPAPLRELNPRVDDELGTIVSMCLHKELRRRYQIAGELARDIERYRAGLPIEAKRDSAGYLLAKTIRRHRAAAVLTVLIALLSVGYGVTVSVLYQNAIASEQLAEQRAVDARDKYALARDALEFVVNQVSQNLKSTPHSIAVRRTILEGAFERLAALADQHGDDPLLRGDLMRTHYQLGQIAIDLGRSALARPHLQAALEMRLKLHAERKPTPEELAELSINYVLLGDVANHLGETGACEAPFRKALAIDERLVEDHPDSANFLDNLAWSYDRLGDQALRRGDLANAEVFHRRQLGIMQRLANLEPDNPTRLHGLARAHSRMTRCANRRYDWKVALHHAELAVTAGRRGRATNADSTLHMLQHIDHLFQYTACLKTVDSPIDRSELFIEANELARLLVEREPEVARNQLVLARTLLWLSGTRPVAHDPLKRERMARDALQAIETYLRRSTPTEALYLAHVRAYRSLRAALASQGRDEEAGECGRTALALIEEAIAARLDSPKLHLYRARLLASAAEADPHEVVPIIDAARALFRSLDIETMSQVQQLGWAYKSVGAHESALDMYEMAEQMSREQGLPMSKSGRQALREYREASGE